MTVNNNYCHLKLSVKLLQFYTMSKHYKHAVLAVLKQLHLQTNKEQRKLTTFELPLFLIGFKLCLMKYLFLPGSARPIKNIKYRIDFIRIQILFNDFSDLC